jgi:transcriptional regulator with XRE-family HTH domain
MADMNTLADLLTELSGDTTFKQEYERQKPFYDFSLEVLKRRKALDLTQQALAEKLDWHQSQIARIESSERNISFKKMIELAEALEARLEVKLVPNYVIKDSDYERLVNMSRISTTNESPNRVSFKSIHSGKVLA